MPALCIVILQQLHSADNTAMLLNINQPSMFFQKGIRMRKIVKSNPTFLSLCLVCILIALYHFPVLRTLGMKSVDLLKKGKDVFISKPISPSVDEAKYVKPFVNMEYASDDTDGQLPTKTPTTPKSSHNLVSGEIF